MDYCDYPKTSNFYCHGSVLMRAKYIVLSASNFCSLIFLKRGVSTVQTMIKHKLPKSTNTVNCEKTVVVVSK